MTKTDVEQIKQKDKNILIEKNVKFRANWDEKYVDPEKISDDWNLDMINVQNADKKTKNKIKVAIIDSGIDECDGIGVKERYNLVPSEKDVNPIFDDITGHGTAIASIICGTKDSDRKSYGINDNVELYSIKIMNGDNTASLDRVVEAIYKAIDWDVDIINMSFGTIENSTILQQAVQDAYNDVTNFTSAFRTRINNDINAIKKADLIQIGLHGNIDSSEYKNLDFNYRMRRLLILGMELHVITDAFAHRAYGIEPYMSGNNQDHWSVIYTHDTDGDNVNDVFADDVTLYPSRYEAAGRVVRNVMNQCLVFDNNNLVQMKETGLILSKQIMYNNAFSSGTNFNDRFLLYKLYSYAGANSAYDATFSTYSNALAQVSCEW